MLPIGGPRPVLVAVGDTDEALLGRLASQFVDVVDVVRFSDRIPGVDEGDAGAAVHLFVDRTLRGSLRAPFNEAAVAGLLQRSGAFTPTAPVGPPVAGDDPIRVAAAVARTEDPVAVLAVVVAHLLRSGRIAAGDLHRLGIDTAVAQSVLDAFDRNDNLAGLGRTLAVEAAVRAWRAQLVEIGDEAGIDDPGERDALALALLSFACENDIDDLHLAYRLWSTDSR